MYCDAVTYNPAKLARLGAERIALVAQLEKLQTELKPEIIAADAAEVPQVDICELTGYTRETVRQICLTPEQREAEREKRRQRTRKA